MNMWKQITAALLSAGLMIVPAAHAEEDVITRKIAGMTLRQKVGQLFVIRPDALRDLLLLKKMLSLLMRVLNQGSQICYSQQKTAIKSTLELRWLMIMPRR